MSDQYGIVEADDLLHQPPEGETNWSENLQLVVNDGRTGVYMHLGRQADDPGIWEGILVVYLDGERLLVSRTWLRAPDLTAATSGPLSFRPIVPLREWEMAFDGMVRPISRAEGAAAPVAEGPVVPMTLTLAVNGHSPMWGAGTETSRAASATTSSLHDQDWARTHVQQVCQVSGRLRVPSLGIDQTIENVGFRDHSVGPRDFTHLVSEFWSCCAFPSGRAFVGLHVVQDDRPEPFTHGFVFEGVDLNGRGKLHDMDELTGPLLTSPLGDPVDFGVRFSTAAGSGDVTGHMTNSMAFAFDYPFRMPLGARPAGATPVEGPATYEWDGEQGHGWIERIYIREDTGNE